MDIFFLEDKGNFDLFSRAELGIMTDTRVGIDDRDRVSFMCTIRTKLGASDHWFPIMDEKVLRFLQFYGMSDISKMSGKPCLVVYDGNMVTHVAPYKP